MNGTCEYCGEAEPVTPAYTIKLSECEFLYGVNYFISVPATDMDLIFDIGSETLKGMLCNHCNKKNIHAEADGSTFTITADTVKAHYYEATRRAKAASDFDLILTEGSELFAINFWTTTNTGRYLYIEILPETSDDGGDDNTEGTYTVTLPTDAVGYSVRATSATTVEAGGTVTFKLNIYDDYKKGENFKVLANGTELTASGDVYTISNITENQTVTVEGVVKRTLAEENVTVIAPAGSTVSSGSFHDYFLYDFSDSLEDTTLDDGRVQYIFPALSGRGGFIRVQHPDGVTYWDFGDLAIGKVFNITEEMLFIGSSEYTKKTVYANYEKNGHDTADLYLTANAKGWLDMNTGDTHSLNVFRNWIPVSDSTSNTGVSLPDVTYTVVDVNGNPSNGVVTITPDANNSCYADIQAVGAGTAIILVTYDAVYNADGEGGSQFSAIWPENTGVIVVTVDAADANIQTNIIVNEEANAGGKQVLDVEHDILFYVGDEGAEYSFKPESGCTVSVARSNVGATMTFSGFTSNGVDVSEDGTVTLSGLTTGAHIVKVEKDGKTAYQVIRARQVNYVLKHSDGTEVTSDKPAQPGETITVQFSRLIDPMGKLSGVYNSKYGFYYNGEDGTNIRTMADGYGEYYFGSKPSCQRFNVTVPSTWDKQTYTITDGALALGGWSSAFGAHRSTTYMQGKEPNLNASGSAGVAAVLPDVVIPVKTEDTYSVTLPTGEGYTVTSDETSVQAGESYTFTVTVSDGYDGSNMVVKVNGETISGKDGKYTVEAVSEDLIITVEGVKKIVPVESITLNKTSVELKVNDTVSLAATVKPDNATDKTVTWSSSNVAVAKVENGMVTAVSEGNAVITAKVGDKEATCSVSIKTAQDPDKVKVYLSMSHDADFMVGAGRSKVVALQEINVPWFDLSLYGMEEYTYEEGKPTVLHLYIYATEIFYCGLSEDEAGQGYLLKENLMDTLLQYSGNPGSIFFTKFWGQDCNLLYYVNYTYPAKNGIGITADQLVLKENDIISVGHFSDWGFISDSTSGFNYLDIGGENRCAAVQQYEQFTLQVYLANGDPAGGSSSSKAREDALNIYYAKAGTLTTGVVSQWNKLGTTDSTGKLEIAVDLEPGTYVLALPGQTGERLTNAIVSAPGVILLDVTEGDAENPVQRVISLIDQIDTDITLESEPEIKAATDAYNALTAAQQRLVTNAQKLLDAQEALAQLQQTEEDAEKADGVKELIDAIEEVDLDSEEAIVAARSAYDALTDRQKTLVGTDYEKKLTDAETALQQLKDEVDAVEELIDAIGEGGLDKESDIAAAREAFDDLNDQQKALLGEAYLEKLTEAEAALQEQMDEVETVKTMIDAIGEGGLDKENEILQAMEAFDELNEQQQKLLGTAYRQKLTEAKNDLDEQKAEIETVEDLIEAIGDLTPQSKDDIEEALDAYEALNEAQKARLSQDALRSLEEARAYLQLLEISDADIVNIYQTTGSYLSGLTAPTVGSTNGEWRVIGLARAGRTVADAYYNTVVNYVQAEIDANERLDPSKATENARVILALTAIGKDVTDVGGHNLLRGLNDMDYIRKQGINGPIWTLIALNSHDYTAVGITTDDLIDEILRNQLSDGGWSIGTTSEVDMTAMAIQALAPYYDKDATVKAAVDKALNLLSEMQNANGSFNFDGAPSAESIAQVIVALTALEIDPDEDTRFIKNGITTVQALAQFYVEGGGFKKGDALNMMATEQGYYALVSYFRLLEEKTSLYDMSDVNIETSAGNQAAADAVIALINAIGTVDLTKEDEITAARTAYNALTDAQKALISASTLKKLTDAETELAQLKQTDTDAAAANAVKELIDAIGTVTLDKESAITTARNAYNRLTTLQKNLVGATYLAKLTAAEAELAALKKAAADEAAASAVEQKISNIGTNITLGSESKITTARNAYNALTADQKALVSNYQTLVNAENALSVLKSTVSVTFSLKGCYKHGSGETSVHTLSGGNLQTWIAAKTYKVQPGATVKDLFEKALSDAGLEWKNPTGNYVESIKYNGDWISEFTNGTNSGWMYTLNGKHPNLGVAQQTLVNGDVVVFHYTDDYTKEEGSTSSGTTTGGNTTTSGTTNYITTTTTQTNTATAESVDRLIEDIGEEITLDSAAKIKAARAAYDKLTEAQKKLVKKYDVLVAAEKKLAELKGVSFVDVYAETGNYIQGMGTPGVGAIGGEWMVIGLARSGRTVPTGYYDHVLNYVRENINNEERLHSAKSSDNSRVILGLTAIGKDVTNADGHDLLKGLNSMDYIQKQGINGPIWALIAFDSGNYPVPAGDVSREKLIEVILEAQLDDGGWAMSGERSDPDMTGMAIQALAPYMDSNAEVKKAVETAVWTLSKMQNDNGSFTSVDGPNSESIAQVIVALAALGIDADTDARFVKNGISALDALLTYFVPGGGFRHVLDGNLDGMATEQAYYALVAYNRMKQNQSFLYDMTDVIDRGGDVVVEETTEPTELPTEPVEEEEEDNGNAIVIWTGVMTLCAGAIVVILLNRKKLFGKFL